MRGRGCGWGEWGIAACLCFVLWAAVRADSAAPAPEPAHAPQPVQRAETRAREAAELPAELPEPAEQAELPAEPAAQTPGRKVGPDPGIYDDPPRPTSETPPAYVRGSRAAQPVPPPTIEEQVDAATASKAEFLRLREGMTYWEVRAIIGCAGELTGRTDWRSPVDGLHYVNESYSWKGNAPGAFLVAIFDDGKLTSKAQSGLE